MDLAAAAPLHIRTFNIEPVADETIGVAIDPAPNG
jgi:hypothetical protein